MENPAAKPLIYTTPLPQNPKEVVSGLKANLPKIIFIILGIVVLVEIVLGARALLSNNSTQVPNIQPLSGGVLALTTQKSNFAPNEKFIVNVKLATGGKPSDSTDLVLFYDPGQLKTSSDKISLGETYPDYPIADVDEQLGLIRISGITPPREEGFNGIGSFAQIEFTALNQGKGEIKIEFEKASTTDSNIVASESPSDLLENVINLKYEISQTAKSGSNDQKTNVCQGYLQQCQNAEGLAGSQYCSAGAVKDGACVFDPNLTNSCDVCKIN